MIFGAISFANFVSVKKWAFCPMCFVMSQKLSILPAVQSFNKGANRERAFITTIVCCCDDDLLSCDYGKYFFTGLLRLVPSTNKQKYNALIFSTFQKQSERIFNLF